MSIRPFHQSHTSMHPIHRAGGWEVGGREAGILPASRSPRAKAHLTSASPQSRAAAKEGKSCSLRPPIRRSAGRWWSFLVTTSPVAAAGTDSRLIADTTPHSRPTNSLTHTTTSVLNQVFNSR